jgi:hypothetical protein
VSPRGLTISWVRSSPGSLVICSSLPGDLLLGNAMYPAIGYGSAARGSGGKPSLFTHLEVLYPTGYSRRSCGRGFRVSRETMMFRQ